MNSCTKSTLAGNSIWPVRPPRQCAGDRRASGDRRRPHRAELRYRPDMPWWSRQFPDEFLLQRSLRHHPVILRGIEGIRRRQESFSGGGSARSKAGQRIGDGLANQVGDTAPCPCCFPFEFRVLLRIDEDLNSPLQQRHTHTVHVYVAVRSANARFGPSEPDRRRSDQAECPDRVAFFGQLGDRGIDLAAGEVVDVESLDDFP